LQSLLKESGVCEYSIFLDDETNILFGVMNIHHSGNLDDLPKNPVMRQWWTFMADIMETNEDHSP
jgi:L-rhamnose mutarotase